MMLTLRTYRQRKGELVPVLLRITAEPESAYERFNALASYALGQILEKPRYTGYKVPLTKNSLRALLVASNEGFV